MNSDLNIRLISAVETIDLRSRVLRPGQNKEVCHYPEDNLPSSFHLGVLVKNRIVCNGTFLQQGHAHFLKASLPYRLRGMATDPEFQGQGLGKNLLAKALRELQEKKCDLLWFNARTSAEIFYQKLNFAVIGDIFDIPGVGPHKVMFKWLEL